MPDLRRVRPFLAAGYVLLAGFIAAAAFGPGWLAAVLAVAAGMCLLVGIRRAAAERNTEPDERNPR